MQIYMDNAATSFPKAPGVAESISEYITNVGCNINRGGYKRAYDAAYIVLETRELIAEVFNFPIAQNVIFTANVTASLNYLIKGLLHKGGHILVSSIEHNAVMRPLVQMTRQNGASFDRIPCDEAGRLQIDKFASMIRPDTKAVVITHASNVSGTILPIAEVGAICYEHGIPFIVDTAQTAGFAPIDMQACHISAVAFTGHKGLLGPQGIGGFVITDQLAAAIEPLMSGGTGSFSDSEDYPELLPDKFEPGTSNLPGIFGLNAALKYLKDITIAQIRDREMALWQRLYDGCSEIKQARIIGPGNAADTTAVLSLDFKDYDNAAISFVLADQYGIMTRCGIHCAPSAHKTFCTFPQGTVRFSIGHCNTEQEIDLVLQALREIL